MLRCLLDADALAWLLRLDSDPAHDEHRQAWLAEAQRQRATLLIPAAMLFTSNYWKYIPADAARYSSTPWPKIYTTKPVVAVLIGNAF